MSRVLSSKQITLPDAIKLIDSDECENFEIHYRVLIGNQKGNIYFTDAIDDDPELTIEKFIQEADNYGSFWLTIWAGKDVRVLQIVDETTFEPL